MDSRDVVVGEGVMVQVEAHSHLLNISYFDVDSDSIEQVAGYTGDRVKAQRDRRRQDRQIRWLREMRRPQIADGRSGPEFVPRVYALAGTFDLAAIFCSPTLDFTAWTSESNLSDAGLSSQTCFLPKLSSLGLEEDLNDIFLKKTLDLSDGSSLPPDQAFVAITHIKLNPLALFPSGLDSAESEVSHFTRTLTTISATLEDWRRGAKVAQGPGRPGAKPLAALGLGLGWSELVVVAFADAPGKLLRLALKLRQSSQSVRARPEEPGRCNPFLSTVSAVGFDSALRAEASEAWKTLTAPVAVERLIAASENANDEGMALEDAASGNLAPVYFQSACHSCPGSELDLVEAIAELEAALRARFPQWPWCEPDRREVLELGKRDTWAPSMWLGPFEGLPGVGLSPRQLARLLVLVQKWLRHGAGKALRRVSDFYTRFGGSGLAARAIPPGDDCKPGEQLFVARTLMPKALQEDDAWEGVRKAIEASMRRLQLPYSRRDQLSNCLNALRWVLSKEVVWDEGVELASSLFALKSFLDTKVRWWEAVSQRDAPLGNRPRLHGDAEEVQMRWAEEIRDVLGTLNKHEVPDFLRDYRAYFYNRHLSSFLVYELPDANLRYRGSIHQLLSVANLIVSVLAAVVAGPRSTFAILGEGSSPEVDAPCGTLVVKLNLASLSTPLLLEAIAHEVGHYFVVHLFRSTIDDFHAHRWEELPKTPEATDLFQAARALNRDIFLGQLHPLTPSTDRQRFIESTADWIEKTLLAYTDDGDWVRSVSLQMLFASLPVEANLRTEHRERSRKVPYTEASLVESVMRRMVLVVCADSLVGWSEAASVRAWRESLKDRLDLLQQHLFEQAFLGPSPLALGLAGVLERWRAFCEDVIRQAPWLSDEEALRASAKFFQRLEVHLQARLVPAAKATGPLKLGREVNAAFAAHRQAFWAAVGGSASRGLVVRHWMDAYERCEVRERSARWCEAKPGEEEAHREGSWVAWPAPYAFLDAIRFERDQKTRDHLAEKTEYKVDWVLFQRGRLLVLDDAAQRATTEAMSAFYLRLMPLIPAWRALLLEQIVKVEGLSDGAGS